MLNLPFEMNGASRPSFEQVRKSVRVFRQNLSEQVSDALHLSAFLPGRVEPPSKRLPLHAKKNAASI
jgi:hypothetical protein